MSLPYDMITSVQVFFSFVSIFGLLRSDQTLHCLQWQAHFCLLVSCQCESSNHMDCLSEMPTRYEFNDLILIDYILNGFIKRIICQFNGTHPTKHQATLIENDIDALLY